MNKVQKKTFDEEDNNLYFLSNEIVDNPQISNVEPEGSDFSDEYCYPNEEIEVSTRESSNPANDSNRMTSATSQDKKDSMVPGVITETTTLFDPNNIVRKKIRT